MLPDYPPLFWFTAVTAVILVGIAKSGFGGGAGVIATPLMALTIPVADAAALLLPLLIIIDMLSLPHYWRSYDQTSIRQTLPGALAGIVIGGIFFGIFASQERLLEIGIGLIAVLFVIWFVGRETLLGALDAKRPSAVAGAILGAASGFASTLAHAGGPPITVYLVPQKLPQQIFVGTTVIYFAIVNLVKLIPYALLGLLQIGNLTTILILAPLAYVGVKLGVWLNGRFSPIWFNRLVIILLLLTGLQLLLGTSFITLLAG